TLCLMRLSLKYQVRNLSQQFQREGKMAKPQELYQCQTVNCGYIYNPDKGDRRGKIPKGTDFNDLPDDWKCPVCGAGKKMFKPLAGPGSAS
ncbi:MAG: rubredoxin, partial [Desulfobacterales bacterium]